jgi:acetyl esterase/lipase
MQPFFGGEERTESEIKLVGVPLISVERTDWMWKAFLPEGSDRNHSVVNVFGPNAVDISGVKFPATLLFVGGFDPLQDWQKRYHEGLKKSGKEVHLVEYPNVFHGFYCLPESPEFSLLIGEVKSFVHKQSSLT